MKQVTTEDDSITFYNEQYDETYHSITGAKEEAINKYAKPLQLSEFAKENKEIYILDVCFGLGYNTAACIDAVRRSNKRC